jgi:hypothetical protein
MSIQLLVMTKGLIKVGMKKFTNSMVLDFEKNISAIYPNNGLSYLIWAHFF